MDKDFNPLTKIFSLGLIQSLPSHGSFVDLLLKWPWQLHANRQKYPLGLFEQTLV